MFGSISPSSNSYSFCSLVLSIFSLPGCRPLSLTIQSTGLLLVVIPIKSPILCPITSFVGILFARNSSIGSSVHSSQDRHTLLLTFTFWLEFTCRAQVTRNLGNHGARNVVCLQVNRVSIRRKEERDLLSALPDRCVIHDPIRASLFTFNTLESSL